MSLRPRHGDPVLNLSSQRLVEGSDTDVWPPRAPGRPYARQTRSRSIGQLEFFPVSSLSSSLSHPSVMSSPISAVQSFSSSSSYSSSGSRFAAFQYRSSYFKSMEVVSGLPPTGFSASHPLQGTGSIGYLTGHVCVLSVKRACCDLMISIICKPFPNLRFINSDLLLTSIKSPMHG